MNRKPANDPQALMRVTSISSNAHRSAFCSGQLSTAEQLVLSSGDYSRSGFPVRLYRFMAGAVPIIKSVIWTWSRLAAAPGHFSLEKDGKEKPDSIGRGIIDDLFNRINIQNFGHGGDAGDLLQPFFQSLFLDGAVDGRVVLEKDLSGIAGFEFFDLARTELSLGRDGAVKIKLSDQNKPRYLSGPDLYFYPFDASLANPLGQSILRAVPFVTRIEQQLVDDMRRTAHNAGYHRLHIRIKPPDRREGESDDNYVNRANEYFDKTLSMIKEIEPQDNPVTWDDVVIDYIGPQHTGGQKSNQWYLHHRAMVEEVCSGTHLAPFMLGYSYNATTNWAQFKHDLIMRQVGTVQNAAVSLLNRLAGLELALKGSSFDARWEFDNNFSALAGEMAEVKSRNAARIVDLFRAGLIDQDTATREARRCL